MSTSESKEGAPGAGRGLKKIQVWRRPSDSKLDVKEMDDHTNLGPDTVEFSLVSTIIHYAICIMENKVAQTALMKVVQECCEGWGPKGLKIWDNQQLEPVVANMELVVKSYVSMLRESFYPVVLNDVEHNRHMSLRAKLVPLPCAFTGRNVDDVRLALKDTARIEIVSTEHRRFDYLRLLWRDSKHYETAHQEFRVLMMQMCIVMSHELSHAFRVFVTYLLPAGSGDHGIVRTPPSVYYDEETGELPVSPCAEYAGRTTGETGTTFELYMWGGAPHFGFEASEDRPPDQFEYGGTYLEVQYVEDGQRKARRVSNEAVDSFFEGPEGKEDLEDFDMTKFLHNDQGPEQVEVQGEALPPKGPEFWAYKGDAATWLAERAYFAAQMEHFKNASTWTIKDDGHFKRFINNPGKQECLIPAEEVKPVLLELLIAEAQHALEKTSLTSN